MRKLVGIVVLLVLIGASGGWYWYRSGGQPVTFRTVQIERGDLLVTTTATGTIEPVEVIDVGAQIAGQILSFGKDPRNNGKVIDWGSPVEQGTILAEIDKSLYQAQVESAQAMVESAEASVQVADANLARARADLGQMEAKLTQSNRDWVRAQRMQQTRTIADADVDQYEQALGTARSTLKVGEATIIQCLATLNQAKASLNQNKAALKNAQINLGYCTIRSPVKGIIVDRRVNTGQTVVSSLSAPSLFLIAKDLKHLQVWASVNEADVGSIHSGQKATFTIDTYPGRVFEGVVAPDQPRLNASMNQNVVTYTVAVDTDNSDGKLIPYLTATLRFEVVRKNNVLLVPNGALRWKPLPPLVAPDVRDEYFQKQQRRKSGTSAEATKSSGEKEQHTDRGVLWIEDGKFVRPIKVRSGMSDGLMTEIFTDNLAEGTSVVIGENRSGTAVGTKNPFAPKMFGGK